jgi:nucleotide-binding universal stress UspA family protein
MLVLASPGTAARASQHDGKRVLVLFEAGHAGIAAVERAHELAEHDKARLTVVSVVPQVPAGRCGRCGCSPLDYNAAVRDAVAEELGQARERLAELGDRASFELLLERTDPPLPDWSAAAGFDVILLPAHRRPLRSASHPAATALRRTGAEVWIVDPRAQPTQTPD